MGIRMSIARCCCAVVEACTKVYCLFDDFSTYGTGNTVIGEPTTETTQWEEAFPSIGNTVATQNSSGQLEISSSVSGDSDRHGIIRRWGVSGQGDSPDFTSGYANATSLEFDLVSFDWASGFNNPSLSAYIGLDPNGSVGFRPTIEFDSTFSNNQTRYRATFLYVGGSALVAQTGFNNSGDTSAIEGTYKIEIYDGAIVSGSYKFEWKVWFGGSVVVESLTGATRNYAALTFDCGDGLDNWCALPRVQFYNYIVAGGKEHPTITLDNIKLAVNGDTTCHSGAPAP